MCDAYYAFEEFLLFFILYTWHLSTKRIAYALNLSSFSLFHYFQQYKILAAGRVCVFFPFIVSSWPLQLFNPHPLLFIFSFFLYKPMKNTCWIILLLLNTHHSQALLSVWEARKPVLAISQPSCQLCHSSTASQHWAGSWG